MNKPIGCTKCGGNDHNADECKRFAGERERFEAELVAKHGYQPKTLRGMRHGERYISAGLNLAWRGWQARATQPQQASAWVALSEQVKPQLVWLPDGFGGGEHVHVYRASDYDALAAECERLRGELEVRTAQRDAAQTSIGGLQVIIEDQEAELSALKAQQMGQEPQRCQCCGYLVTESEHRGCLRAAAPQPAPLKWV